MSLLLLFGGGSAGSTISPAAGSLAYTGRTPSLVTPSQVEPAQGALTYTGRTPSLSNSGLAIHPGKGGLVFTGFAPSLLGLPLVTDLIPPVNNLEQVRKRANAILARLYDFLPGYGPALPTVDADLDGRLFVLTTSQTLYQQQYGAWVAVDMVP